ncbi:hypothetical protein EDD15DRAFT_955998 [Pisolithus albus]|nr:hypothetical protein EDD15DRAFT_955998 [Pisolithus albus]
MSLEPSDPLDAFINPAQPFPPMNWFQATGSNTSIGHPAPGQEYVGQNCSGVGAAGTTLCAPNPVNSASFPSEVSQAHTSPARLEDSATSVTPQETSRSSGDLKPCEWRNDQGGICGELLGRDCERHLALAHRIRGLPADMVVVCGACGEGKKRKFFVRHFREVHLRIPRQRRNVT